jgi:hypothetical protein
MAIALLSEIEAVVKNLNETELEGWVASLVSYIDHPPLPKTGSLQSIILAEARNYGPSPTTGGHLTKCSLADSLTISSGILKWAPQYGLDPAWVAAGMAGESCFCITAENPNNQDAKPNETPLQAFMHWDGGLGQFDGNTVISSLGIFADLAPIWGPGGKSSWSNDLGAIYETKAKIFDPEWSVQHFCAFLKSLKDATNEEVYLSQQNGDDILKGVYNQDIDILTAEAYNAGFTGARLISQKTAPGASTAMPPSGSWSYGINWKNRYTAYKAILQGQ